MVVDEKMKVLEELCVVNKENYNEIHALLTKEIYKNRIECPNPDPDRVADRVARMLISKSFE